MIEPMFGTRTRAGPNDCQVLTLGAGSSSHDQNSWINIDCGVSHHPRSNGLCINGVLNYFAYMGTSEMKPCLVRFEVRSEEFDFLTILPEEVRLVRTSDPELINYQGNVAFVNRPNLETYELGLWVLEDVEKQKWVKQTLSVSPWESELPNGVFDVRGTTQTGEVIYASYEVDDFYLAHHDLKMSDLKVVVIEENSECKFERFSGVVCFLDYVESAMFS